MPSNDNDHPAQSQPPSAHLDPETTMAPDETALAIIEEQADRSIRRLWHDGRLFFSVIDVIGVLTDSPDAGAYWRKLKQRMKEEENAHETVTKCHALRMTAADGKQRLTDAADTETLLRIIQSVPSPKAEPIKQWLARVGAQRFDAVTRPLDATQAHARRGDMAKPAPDAPALDWAEYHEQMAALYRRQATHEWQLAIAQAQLDEHDERLANHDAELAVLQDWVGHLEKEQHKRQS